jgi:hypothetical protein
MNWTRVLLGGLVAGIVTNLADFVMHGMIMAHTYKNYYQVFTQTQASPAKFAAVSIVVSIFIAILFAKTRGSWADGARGGVALGLLLGLAVFLINLY